jgi:hypothetical protein
VNAAVNPYAPPTARLTDTVAAAPLWTPSVAGLWCLLLSPMFGSYVMMRNWKALGEDDRARSARTWLYVSIAVFAIALLVPAGGLIGLPYLVAWYFAVNRPQIKFVKEAFGDDYERRPWARLVLVWLAGVVVAGLILGFVSAAFFGVQ